MNKLMLTSAILQMYNGIPRSNGFASAIDIAAQGYSSDDIDDSVFLFDFAQAGALKNTELASE